MNLDAPTVARLAQALRARGWVMSCAESCTGGLVAATCTSLAGSSQWFECGFITYSNAAKTAMLGVPAHLIAAHGAVSEVVVRVMVEGAAQRARTHASLAITGIAGPAGGIPGKPVGTVWFGWYVDGKVSAQRQIFTGGRDQVRQQAVQCALQGLLERVEVCSL